MTDRQTVTLDFTKGYDAHTTLVHVRDGCTDGCSVVASLVQQIEKQTRPAIEEPGLWGVVGAHLDGGGQWTFCRARDGWVCIEDGSLWEWDRLVNPALIREGVKP